MSCEGDRCVSRTRRRIGSEERKRRGRCTGNAIGSDFSVANAGSSKCPYMNQKVAKRWLIDGSVQGVGFRLFAQHKATALGLSGWARNLPDGGVEVYAVGPAAKLSEFAASLHSGPRMAQVRTVEEREAAVENLSGFAVR